MPARKGAGRKPKPTALRLAQGNQGRKAIRADEPKPDPAAPEMPDFLGEAARAEWSRIVPELEAIGVLARADRAALAAYCDAFGRWEEATKKIAESGSTFFNQHGDEKRSPWTVLQREALAELRQFVVEFGMTPSSRTRVSAKPPATSTPKKPGAQFFGARAG